MAEDGLSTEEEKRIEEEERVNAEAAEKPKEDIKDTKRIKWLLVCLVVIVVLGMALLIGVTLTDNDAPDIRKRAIYLFPPSAIMKLFQ